jgi:uncharacterized protein
VSGGFPAGVVAFAENLRAEGLAVGTSELLDAFAALGEVPWTEEAAFREALAATLAKSPEDRRVFDLVFERFFFRAAEEAAMRQGVREQAAGAAGGEDEDGRGEAGDEPLGEAEAEVDMATSSVQSRPSAMDR